MSYFMIVKQKIKNIYSFKTVLNTFCKIEFILLDQLFEIAIKNILEQRGYNFKENIINFTLIIDFRVVMEIQYLFIIINK